MSIQPSIYLIIGIVLSRGDIAENKTDIYLYLWDTLHWLLVKGGYIICVLINKVCLKIGVQSSHTGQEVVVHTFNPSTRE